MPLPTHIYEVDNHWQYPFNWGITFKSSGPDLMGHLNIAELILLVTPIAFPTVPSLNVWKRSIITWLGSFLSSLPSVLSSFSSLVHSHCFHHFHLQLQQAAVFREHTSKPHSTLPVQHETTNRQSYQLAGNHSDAFSCYRARYFPLELVETKSRAKRIKQVRRNTTLS